MTKLDLLALVLTLIVSAQSQFRPEPPVRILNRRVSIPTFKYNFQEVFCTMCEQRHCTENLNRVNKIPQTEHFNPESIQKNIYGIKEANVSIGTVNVSCKFQKRVLANKQMDFVLYMPVSNQKVLKGVVMYYHPTLFGAQQVPTSTTDEINALAGLYISNAYAVLFIDYLGYEIFEQYPHPYVQYPLCNVKSSLIALNKALTKLKAEFPAVIRFKLFTAGYSEGAAYALWIERCLSQPQDCGNVKLDDAYEYQAAAAMSGPYDLLKAFKPFLINQVRRFSEKDNAFHIESQEATNFNKAPLLAMTLMSYIYYSQGMDDYSNKMNAEFWKMQCTRNSDQGKCKVNDYQYIDIFYIFDNSLHQVCKLSSNVGQNVDHSNGQLLANLFALSFIKSNTR